MAFKKGDRVRVTDQRSIHKGRTGVVETVYDSASCIVKLNGLRSVGLYFSELELANPEREPLIGLAEKLNEARLQSDEIKSVTSDYGVDESIKRALVDTLQATCYKSGRNAGLGHRAYDLLVRDGIGVREALAAVLGEGSMGGDVSGALKQAERERDELRRRLAEVEGLCRGWEEDFERHRRDITADTDPGVWRASECAEDIREVLRSDALSVEQEKQGGNHE